MNKEIYEYTNYRSYLLDWAADRPKQGRGFRASLARTISCPISGSVRKTVSKQVRQGDARKDIGYDPANGNHQD